MSPAEQAAMDILEVLCGYARFEGKHVCGLKQQGKGTGCTPIPWPMVRVRVGQIVAELVKEVER